MATHLSQTPLKPTASISKGESDFLGNAHSSIRPATFTRKQLLILTLLSILLVGAYAAVIIPALTGLTFDGKQGGSFMLLNGLAFWYLWKCRKRKGWIGALAGVIVSVLVVFLSGGIAGYVRGQPEYVLEHTPYLVALKKTHPQAYEKIHQDVMAAIRSKNVSAQDIAEKINATLQPLALRALKSTSAEALLQFGKARVQMIQEVAAVSAEDCVLVISGEVPRANFETQKRIIASVSQESKKVFQDALLKVLADADASGWEDLVSKDEINALFNQLDDKLKSVYGINYLGEDALKQPAAMRCKAELLLLKEVLNLPTNDRSLMLRVLLNSE